MPIPHTYMRNEGEKATTVLNFVVVLDQSCLMVDYISEKITFLYLSSRFAKIKEVHHQNLQFPSCLGVCVPQTAQTSDTDQQTTGMYRELSIDLAPKLFFDKSQARSKTDS